MSQADEQEPFAAVPGRLQSGVSRGYVSQKSVWSLGLKQNKKPSEGKGACRPNLTGRTPQYLENLTQA